MLDLLHYGMFFLVLLVNLLVIRQIIRKKMLLSPYMFFYILVTTELLGPLFYYLVLNGTSYRSFSNRTLYVYYGIALFTACVFFLQSIIKKETSVSFGLQFNKLGSEKTLFYYYMLLVFGIILFYIVRYRNQLLLFNVLRGNNDSLVRSDTSGAIPHWYTVSSLISLILPSFYFYYSDRIKSQLLSFLLFLMVAFITIIDGNKGLFIYLVLFMFMYVYKFKLNKYTLTSIVAAFLLYFLLKAGKISEVWVVISSAFRRFFVTQGACFINRIQMVADGYDFSHSERISKDVFTYMYHYPDGAAPTLFWGDIYVKHGLAVVLVVIAVSNWIMYSASDLIVKEYYDNKFMYWAYASVAYIICMSELSFEHILRIVMVLLNCLVFVMTVGKRTAPEERDVLLSGRNAKGWILR